MLVTVTNTEKGLLPTGTGYWVFAMEMRDLAYDDMPGYHLSDHGEETLNAMGSPICEETLLMRMYECGQFAGLQDDWSWSLVPTDQSDLEHIESVIVPYGRGIIRKG